MAIDLMSIVIEIASKVINTLIADLLMNKHNEVTNKYVEKEVIYQITMNNQIGCLNIDINTIKKDILDEIFIILRRDPDIKISDEKIELIRSKCSQIPLIRGKFVQSDIELRLKRLDEIIAQRRMELVSEETLRYKNRILWERSVKEKESPAQKALEKMNQRIKERRRGDDAN